MATIPKDSCLTVNTSSAKDIIEDYGFEGPLGLSFALMYEISLGHASPWAPYLHLLPDSEPLPLVWTLDEVDSLLCGTELHKVRFVESFDTGLRCRFMPNGRIKSENHTLFGLEPGNYRGKKIGRNINKLI